MQPVGTAPVFAAQRGQIDPRIVVSAGFLLTGVGMGGIATFVVPEGRIGALAGPLALSICGALAILEPLVCPLQSLVRARALQALAFLVYAVLLSGSFSSAALAMLISQRDHLIAAIVAGGAGVLRLHVTDTPILSGLLLSLSDAPSLWLACADAASALSALSLLFIPCLWTMNRPVWCGGEAVTG